eukprot:5441714-Alexandrium_andersonii.AAC.1
MDVDTDEDLAPARPPSLPQAGGLPQARVATLQTPAGGQRIGRARWAPPPVSTSSALNYAEQLHE